MRNDYRWGVTQPLPLGTHKIGACQRSIMDEEGHTRPRPSLRSKQWLLERTCVFLRQSHGLASHIAIAITILASHYSASWSVSYRIIKLTETKRRTIQKREEERTQQKKEGGGRELQGAYEKHTNRHACNPIMKHHRL